MRGLVAVLSLLGLAACAGKESPIRTESEALLADMDDVLAAEGDTASVGAEVANSDAMSAPEPSTIPLPCYSRERKIVDAFNGVDVYQLRGCGPQRARGAITVRWQLRSLTAHIEMEAKELSVGTTLVKSGTITADVTGSGKARTVLWRSHFEGWVRTDTQPRAFVRDSDKTLRWMEGAPCLTTDGSSTGTFETPRGARSVSVSMIGLRTCGGPCPEPNSRLRLENALTREHVELRFTAPGRALLVDTEGKSLPIKPACAR